MSTNGRLAIGVAVVVAAVVGIFAGMDGPVHEFWLAALRAEAVTAAGLVAHALLDLLWRLLLVLLVIDIGLTLTYRWSNGLTCPMLCLLTAEAYYHYVNAMWGIVDVTLGYWFPVHHQKDQEAF